MSSGGCVGVCCLCRVGEQGAVDDVGEASFVSAASFVLGVASGSAAGVLGDGVRVVAALGDRDAVNGRIELAVPGAREAVTVLLA